MSTMLHVVLYVFAGAAALALTFGPITYLFSDIDYRSWQAWLAAWVWTLLCIGLLVGGLLLYLDKHPDNSANACADRGGVWSVVGSHQQLVGKVITTVNDYACVTPS
jgi:hypothetical protein